eukprot:gene2424-3762_t
MRKDQDLQPTPSSNALRGALLKSKQTTALASSQSLLSHGHDSADYRKSTTSISSLASPQSSPYFYSSASPEGSPRAMHKVPSTFSRYSLVDDEMSSPRQLSPISNDDACPPPAAPQQGDLGTAHPLYLRTETWWKKKNWKQRILRIVNDTAGTAHALLLVNPKTFASSDQIMLCSIVKVTPITLSSDEAVAVALAGGDREYRCGPIAFLVATAREKKVFCTSTVEGADAWVKLLMQYSKYMSLATDPATQDSVSPIPSLTNSYPSESVNTSSLSRSESFNDKGSPTSRLSSPSLFYKPPDPHPYPTTPSRMPQVQFNTQSPPRHLKAHVQPGSKTEDPSTAGRPAAFAKPSARLKPNVSLLTLERVASTNGEEPEDMMTDAVAMQMVSSAPCSTQSPQSLHSPGFLAKNRCSWGSEALKKHAGASAFAGGAKADDARSPRTGSVISSPGHAPGLPVLDRGTLRSPVLVKAQRKPFARWEPLSPTHSHDESARSSLSLSPHAADHGSPPSAAVVGGSPVGRKELVALLGKPAGAIRLVTSPTRANRASAEPATAASLAAGAKPLFDPRASVQLTRSLITPSSPSSPHAHTFSHGQLSAGQNLSTT